MIISKKNILTLVVALMTNLLMAQTPIYLEVSDCTMELKYAYSETSGKSYEYYHYRFSLNDYESAILKTSLYPIGTVTTDSKIAALRIACGESLTNQLSLEVIEKIQAGTQKIFLLKPNDFGFSVLQVTDAIYQVYLPSDKYLRIVATDYGFDYNALTTHTPGTELKTSGEGEFILFSAASNSCYDNPTFMHVPYNFMETVNIEYVLGLGALREYSELVEHRLVEVDEQPIQQYLATFCDQDIVEVDNSISPKLYEVPTEVPMEESVEEYVVVTNQQTNHDLIVPDHIGTTIITSDGNVEEEENGEINMLFVEEGLEELIQSETFVSKGMTTFPKSNSGDVDFVGAKKKNVFKSTPVVRKTIENPFIHVVKKGETLYSISNQHGLSTLKLKALNQLEDNIIEIGQQLILK